MQLLPDIQNNTHKSSVFLTKEISLTNKIHGEKYKNN